MKVKVTNPSGKVIAGMVDNLSYNFPIGETVYDGPIGQFKHVCDVLNIENGVALKAEETK